MPPSTHAFTPHRRAPRRRRRSSCVEAVTAAAYGIPAGERSWREAAGEVERCAPRYAQAGYGHGHRVGLLLENRPAFLIHWLALNALGVSVVPINAEMRAGRARYLIGHSEIVLAVVLPGREGDLRCAPRRPRRRDARDDPTRGARPHPGGALAGALRAPADRPRHRVRAALHLGHDRPAERLPPRQRLLPARRPLVRRPRDVAEVRPDHERFITPLPLNHVNAMAFSPMAAILSGGCLVQLDRFHPQTWWQSVRESRATIVHYLGVMPAMLLVAAADRATASTRCASASAPASTRATTPLRGALRLSAARGVGDDRDRRRRLHHGHREPRHVGTHCFGRAESFVEARVVDDEGRDVAATRPASCWCAPPAPIRAATSSSAT